MGAKLLEEFNNWAHITRETGEIDYNFRSKLGLEKPLVTINKDGVKTVTLKIGEEEVTLNCDEIYCKYYPNEYLKQRLKQGKESIIKTNDLASYLHKCWCEKEMKHYNLPNIFRKGTIQATVYKDRKKYSVTFKSADEAARELQIHKEILAICLMEENLPIADRYRGVRISFGDENRNPKEALEIIKEKMDIIKEEENLILKERIKPVPKKHLSGIYVPSVEEWNNDLEYNVYLESEINNLKSKYFKNF